MSGTESGVLTPELRAWTRRFCRHLCDEINAMAEREQRGPGDVLESLTFVATAIIKAKAKTAQAMAAKANQAFQRRNVASGQRRSGRSKK